MKRLAPLVAVAVVPGVVLLATAGGATRKTPAGPATSAVGVRSTPLGQTLVDAHGNTLYLFRGDGPNTSRLSAAGLAVWPAFKATVKPHALGGASAADIGSTTGTGGKAQVTYKGHPLYYYVGDHAAGNTNGQGLNQFGSRWYVLAPSGNAITTAAASSNSGSGSGPGGAYGY